MKTLLKLIMVASVFGFATANAAYTSGQQAAIDAVKTAVESGDEDAAKAAVSAQIGAFPEIAGDIVEVGLRATTSSTMQDIIVRAAAWTAPGELGSIFSGIHSARWIGPKRISILRFHQLVNLALNTANAAKAAGRGGAGTPPPVVS